MITKVFGSTSIDASKSGEVTVACPSGTQVLSCQCDFGPNGNDHSVIYRQTMIEVSGPAATVDGCLCAGKNAQHDGSLTLTVVGVCLAQ